ncbi:MAG: CopG family antitoxin [Patescibacteria group bacterium]
MKKLRSIPKFKNEDEEQDFWASHDTTHYFNMNRPVKLNLSSLKKTSKSITIRLPIDLINRRSLPISS